MVPSSAIKAQSSDLYLDGRRLADAVSEKILPEQESSILGLHEKLPSLYKRIYSGNPYYAADHPKLVALRRWLLRQNNTSVKPDQLIQKAIEIESNNAQSGLKLAWSLVAASWKEPANRNNEPIYKKLYDITGEIELFTAHEKTVKSKNKSQKIRTIRGDKATAWTHMLGTALAAYTSTRNARIMVQRGIIKTNFLIFMHEHVLNQFFWDYKKHASIDYAGAQFGYWLARNIEQHKTKSSFLSSDRRPSEYLYDNSHLYGSSWVLPQNGSVTHSSTPDCKALRNYQQKKAVQSIIRTSLKAAPLVLVLSAGGLTYSLLASYTDIPEAKSFDQIYTTPLTQIDDQLSASEVATSMRNKVISANLLSDDGIVNKIHRGAGRHPEIAETLLDETISREDAFAILVEYELQHAAKAPNASDITLEAFLSDFLSQ